MGQQEVKEILIKHENWLLAREIAEKSDTSLGTIFRSLSRLHKNKEIKRDKAVNVIKDKDRLSKTLPHVFAYKINIKP